MGERIKSIITVMLLMWVVVPFPVMAVSDSEAIVISRLAHYAYDFPEIKFIHLSNNEDYVSLEKALEQLGNSIRNVDYEFIESTRTILVEAQKERILFMLNNSAPSATLFSSGDNDYTVHQRYVCVITLDQAFLTRDQLSSTRFISGENDFYDNDIPAALVINNNNFLRYTVDHEAFHCIDAYINGPTRPLTTSNITASYSDFRSEQRADLYAALSFRMNSNNESEFINKLKQYRIVSLLDWDVTHYTSPALDMAMSISLYRVQNMSRRELALYSMREADHFVLSRDAYARFLASVYYLALELNIELAMLAPESTELLKRQYEREERVVEMIAKKIEQAKNKIAGLGDLRNMGN